MATFFPKRSFYEEGKKIFFRRGPGGPTYEVTASQRLQIIKATHRLHLKMALIIVFSFAAFGIFILFLPRVLDLPFELAMGIMLALIVASLAPLGLTLRFHLAHQKQIRKVLGKKTSLEYEMTATETGKTNPQRPPKPAKRGSLMDVVRQRERKVRFVWVFLLGIIFSSLGITMLASSETLTMKTLFIWVLFTMTGLGLLLVGTLGIIYRFRDSRSPEKHLRK